MTTAETQALAKQYAFCQGQQWLVWRRYRCWQSAFWHALFAGRPLGYWSDL